MMFRFLLLNLISVTAFAQSYSPEQLDVNGHDELYSGVVRRADRSFQKLKDDYEVQVNPETEVYRLPEYMYDKKFTSIGDLQYTSCNVGAGRSAQLLAVNDDMAVVRLHGGPCSDTFNLKDRDPNLVIVKASSLQDIHKVNDTSVLQTLAKPFCSLAKAPISLLDGIIMHPVKTGVKDDSDLERYFACYPTKNSDDYAKYYKKLIDLAGEVFSVRVFDNEDGRKIKPANETDGVEGGSLGAAVSAKSKIMKCVIFRESRWDAKIRNPGSGATGLGQQTDIDVEAIKCLIAGCKKDFRLPVRDKKSHKVEERIVEKFVEAEPWAKTLWHNYFVRARKTLGAAAYNKLMTNPLTGAPCTETMTSKERDAVCPINSLAAVALDHIVMDMAIRSASNKVNDDFTIAEMRELTLVLGAAHDAGISKAASAARSSGDIYSWAKVLVKNKNSSRSKELRDYYRDLNHCLNVGDFEPMNGYPKRDCSQAEASR